MVVVERSRSCTAAPGEIWPLVATPAALPRWFVLAKSVEVLDAAAPKRWRHHGEWGGKPFEVDVAVTAFEPPNRLAWRHEAERLNGAPAPRFARETRVSVTLRPTADGTLVTLRGEQEPAGFLRGLLLRLMAPAALGRPFAASLERLGELAEAP